MCSQASPLTQEEEWCPNLGVLCSSKSINTKAGLGPQDLKQWEWKLQSLWDSCRDVLSAIHSPITHWHYLASRDRLNWLTSDSESGCGLVCVCGNSQNVWEEIKEMRSKGDKFSWEVDTVSHKMTDTCLTSTPIATKENCHIQHCTYSDSALAPPSL